MKWHLTVDVGNSQLVIVLYRDELRVDGIRVNTHPFPTPGELTESLLRVLKPQGLVGDQVLLTICSSVPALSEALHEMADELSPAFRHHVSWDSPHGFTASASASREIGADLIAGLVGARLHGVDPFVVVDCGTATTLTLVDDQNHILGVAILPGLLTQMRSLTHSAPHLPQEVRLRPPERPYGNDTEESLQSGILYGHAASIEGLISRYDALFPEHHLRAVGCGGLYRRIASLCPAVTIEEVELVNIGSRVLGARAYSERLDSHAGGLSNTVETQRTFRP